MSAQIPNIKAWLDGPRNYAEGLELLRRYSDNEVIKKALSFGENSWSKAKLKSELEALISVPAPPIIAENSKISTPVAKISTPVANTATMVIVHPVSQEEKDAIAQLEKEWREYYKEMNALNQNCLREDVPQQERLQAAFKIQDLDEKCNAIWAKLDYFKLHGQLPDQPELKPKVNVDDRAALQKRLSTLRTYVSRYKNKPDKLAEYTKELEDIERRLGNA